MKQKFKTTAFWLGLCAGIVIILDTISSVFGVNLYSKEIECIIMSVCSALVMMGIITKKNEDDTKDSPKDELIDEINNKKNK